MSKIFEEHLTENHKVRLRFSRGGGALPRVLNVTDESGRLWEFDCKNEDRNGFCISGNGWKAFAKNKMNCTVTLYKNEDDNSYSITMRY